MGRSVDQPTGRADDRLDVVGHENTIFCFSASTRAHANHSKFATFRPSFSDDPIRLFHAIGVIVPILETELGAVLA